MGTGWGILSGQTISSQAPARLSKGFVDLSLKGLNGGLIKKWR